MPQRDHSGDRTETGEKLKPDDAFCFVQERQTICASHLARKSGQLAGRIKMQERCDQIDAGKFCVDSRDDFARDFHSDCGGIFQRATVSETV